MEQGILFYRELAQLYDELFPVEPEVVDFLRRRARPGRPILDVACGTGSHIVALEGHGLDVYGIDYSPEMVEIAGKRRPERVSRMDMRSIGEHERKPFSLIYSIGNSLSHLALPGDVARFLAEAHNALTPGGTIVLQTIDVSDLDRGTVLPLSTLEAAQATMERSYTITGESPEGAKQIRFDASLYRDGGGPREISQQLLGLSPGLLRSMLEDVGFSAVTAYSGFSEEAYGSGHSRVAVMTAEV